jgi:hypothetical protein
MEKVIAYRARVNVVLEGVLKCYSLKQFVASIKEGVNDTPVEGRSFTAIERGAM